MLDAIDPDKQTEEIVAIHGPTASKEQADAVIEQLANAACEPFDKPAVRNLLKDTKAKTNIVIDEITTDEVISADFDLKRSEETITSFKQFIEDNRDELIALQILYNQQMGKQRLTYAGIRELVTDRPPPSGPC
ncbi:hypothetical protein G7A66_08750 [Altererythrobacter sp. SALINAS58]|nr:hypothetical protein [Alteripontixanthobacter muriae]